MKFYKTAQALCIWVLCFCVISIQAEAKVRISGIVKDIDGKPIEGAIVEVTSKKMDKTWTANPTKKDGKWAIMVDDKNWNFVVKAEGFQTYEEERPLDSLGKKPTLNFILAPGSNAPTAGGMPVANTGDAPAAPQIDLADLKAGNDLFDQGNYQDALASYQQAITKNPDLKQIHISIADAHMKLQNWAEAEREYGMLPDSDPLYERALLGIANAQVKAKNYDKAMASYKKVVEAYPSNSDANYMLGQLLFDVKMDAQGAQSYLEAAATAKPDWAVVHQKLGYVYLNLGNNAKSKAAFQKYLELNPSATDAADIQSMIKDLR